MKTQLFKKYGIGILAILFCAAVEIHAQQRTGSSSSSSRGYGGGGGYGGFGGFGGGSRNSYGSSSSSSSEYNNNGTVGSATISVDPDTHSIVVIADNDTAEQISNVIRNLDQPKPQVLIKVVFLEVEHNNDSDIGVEGGWTGPAGNSQVSAANIFGLSGLNTLATNFNALGGQQSVFPSPASTLGSGGLYQVLGSDFEVTLRALAQAGKAQILSRPSILARDGQLAEIVVGQSIYLPSGVSFTSVGNSSSTTPVINGNYQNVGIILDVTPYIGANGLVEMILQPQTSSLDTSSPGQVIATGGLLGTPIYAPNIDVRSANTVVITPNAQTVVIGGLMENTKSVSESKVPFLGDIPVLGNLFKSKSKSDEKDELMIFLTPHIVQAPNQLAALSGNETSQAAFVTNSISEQELNQYLEHVPMKKNP